MDADTAWKLRNAIGLILDFSDTESLINWLKSRDSFDGIVVSRDEGATWSPLADVPELANVQPTGRRTIMGMAAIGPRGPAPEPAAAPSAAPQSAPGPIAASSPAGPEPDLDAPPSGAQSALDIRAQAQARLAAKRAARAAETGPEPKEEPKPKYSRIRQSKKETNPFLVWAALLVAFLLLGIVLQAAGVITFFEPKSDTGQEIVVNAPPSAAEPEAPQPASADDALQNEVEESFERADQAVSQGNYGDAIAHLERARSLQPDNRQISCRLAGLYGQIEQPERAQEARDRCQGR